MHDFYLKLYFRRKNKTNGKWYKIMFKNHQLNERKIKEEETSGKNIRFRNRNFKIIFYRIDSTRM